jgi:hypothetical protein
MKNKKLLTIAILLIGIFFLVKSRRVDKTTFNIMVLSTANDITEKCIEYNNYRLGKIKEEPSLYYRGLDLVELCNDENKRRKVAEEEMREFFKSQWKFVY